jgi:hypothetical protein
MPADVLGFAPLVHTGSTHRYACARMALPRVERRLHGPEGDVHLAHERRDERTRHLRPGLNPSIR